MICGIRSVLSAGYDFMYIFIKSVRQIFFEILIFLWPMLAVLLWFIVSLVMNIRTPEDHPKKKRRKLLVLISGVITAVWIILLLALSVLLGMAVRNM